MFNDGIITGDDYLRLMGEEATGLPEMQLRFQNANRIPINFSELDDIQRSDKWYKDNLLLHAM